MSGNNISASESDKPANLQITAEQLLSEAYQYRQTPLKAPDYKIADTEELHDYQRRKRNEYENALRRNRFDFGQWIRYARFEFEQHDIARVRSIFERALEVDNNQVPVWIQYILTEVKTHNINHARNLLERSISILPMTDKLWYQYITIEEKLGNIIAVRTIFQRWLQWTPGIEVWKHYIEFEERYKEYDNCRNIFEKFVIAFPEPQSWLLWVSFEKRRGDIINVQNVYKLGMSSLTASHKLNAAFMASWIKLEMSLGKINDALKLYSFGFKNLSSDECEILRNSHSKFQRRYGTKDSVDLSILQSREIKYESYLSSDPYNYGIWWLYLDIISDPVLQLSQPSIEEAFNKAVSKTPTSSKKRDWLPYIYIWHRFLIFEELSRSNLDQIRSLYGKLLKVIPHKHFTFAKIWISYAEFEIRHDNLKKARTILGQSIGICPNQKIISYYISLEIKLHHYDRCRKLFNKLLMEFCDNYQVWQMYIEFENQLQETVRAQAIYDLAINHEFLDSDSKKLLKLKIKDN